MRQVTTPTRADARYKGLATLIQILALALLAIPCVTAEAQETVRHAPSRTDSGALPQPAAKLDARCDGATDDSAAFSTAFSANKLISLPAGVTCIVGDLVLAGPNQTLDCNGSTLQAAPGSLWTLKKSGVNTWIRNCGINDPRFHNRVHSTSITAIPPSATTFDVLDGAGFQAGMPVNIQLSNGAHWPTKTKPTNGVAGNRITIVDPVPATAARIRVAEGGSGCRVGNALVAQGGTGAPVTAKVTGVRAGAVTSLEVQAPGFYSAAPSNPVSLVSSSAPGCVGVAADLELLGASAGATVSGSWGSLIVDRSGYGGIENVTFIVVYAGLGVYSSSPNQASLTTQENFRTIHMNAVRFFGLMVDAGVSVSNFRDIVIFGLGQDASPYGIVGVMRNYTHPTNASPSGGNHFANVATMTFETGFLNTLGNLDYYDDGNTNDTIRNYAFLCNGCHNNVWSGIGFNAFTGRDAYPNAVAGYGIGLYFGRYAPEAASSPTPAISNSMPGNRGGHNAADFYFSDWYGDDSRTGASLWLGHGAVSPVPTFSGFSAAIVSPKSIVLGSSGRLIGGRGATTYLSNGIGSSTVEGDVIVPLGTPTVVTKWGCASTTAPGAGQTFVCNLRAAGATLQSCTISGVSAFGCTFAGPSYALPADSYISLQIVSSGEAAQGRFRWYLSGM